MAFIYGQLKIAQAEILSSAPSSPQTARFYYDTTLSSLRIYSGTAWLTIGHATSGSGSGVTWFAGGGAPREDEENGERVFLYEAGLTQSLSLFYKVPQSYSTGNQIQMVFSVYSPSTSGTILMQAVSTLIRQNVDAVDSTSLSHTKTLTDGSGSGLISNTVANQMRLAKLDITDSAGKIATIAVTAGDLIKLKLQRGTDTDTGDVRFIPAFTEFTT